MEEIKISVIIPTRNRAKLLSTTLDSITKQNFPKENFEVIIIDNGSTDNTKEIAEKYRTIFQNFQYHFAPEPGLHIGRHLGMMNAKAEILTYADDDIVAFSSWLEGIYESFNLGEEIVLVGGKNLPKWESTPPDWIAKLWEKPQEEGQWVSYLSILDFGDHAMEFEPKFVWGCNYSIRKSYLLKLKGFHPDGMPQELIQYRGDGESFVSKEVKKSGLKAYYHPKASVYHWVLNGRMTLEYFKKRCFNQGISDSFAFIRTNKKTGSYANNPLTKIKLGVYNLLIGNRELKKREDWQNELSKSYTEGYKFHQDLVENNTELLNWVLKESYLT